MPRDFLQRRRHRQRITNVILVGVLSLVVGWALTRQPETPAFPVHQSSVNVPSAESDAGGQALLQEVADATLHDAARAVEIHVRLRFPKASGRFPVIVFSPGEPNSLDCREALIRDWVSHGYVIVQVTRVTTVRTVTQLAMEKVRLRHAMSNHARLNPSGTGPLDVTSVIDSLAALQTRFPSIREKLDVAHIGVAGDGAGAVAAEAIGGAQLELRGKPRANFADPRVRAVLCISPQGPGQSGLTDHSFDRLILPYLGISWAGDPAPGFAPAAWHRAPFERSQPGDKYQLRIQGENEAAFINKQFEPFGDPKRNSKSFQSAAGQVRAGTLAFWDAYLKHDIAAKRYLESDALEKTSHGVVALERR